MGKITDRRERTAHTVIENKAVLADGVKPKGEFPYKKLIIAVLAIIAVVACVLLIMNAFVDSYADKFNTGDSHIDASATVTPSGEMYENKEELLTNPSFRNAYLAAADNHAKRYANIASDPDIKNYIVDINSDVDADSANVSVIMLLSLNSKTQKITYFAINKSVLVNIPTVGVGPVYDAFAFGGPALLARTVQENFGLEVSGYVDMPLDSFVQATLDVGGIKLDDQTLTEDEQKLDSAQKIYNYVEKAEDRNAAMTTVIKSLAAKSADAGVLGLKDTIDTVSNSLTASIERENFGDLVKVLIAMFKNDSSVFQIGYDSAANVTEKVLPEWNKPFDGFMTMNYDYEVAKLIANIYPTTAK